MIRLISTTWYRLSMKIAVISYSEKNKQTKESIKTNKKK